MKCAVDDVPWRDAGDTLRMLWWCIVCLFVFAKGSGGMVIDWPVMFAGRGLDVGDGRCCGKDK